MYTLYYAPGAASLVVHWLLIEIGAWRPANTSAPNTWRSIPPGACPRCLSTANR